MSYADQGSSFLKEFKDFITFLRNLWGILAGVSVLFPLSNTLLHLIPLNARDSTGVKPGVLVWLSPTLFTTLTTLVSIFLVLVMFGQRQKFKSKMARARIERQAWISFAIGLVTLVVYLVVYYFLLSSSFSVVGWESADIRRLIGEVPLLILYGTFFAFLTRAFMLLGMSEYFRRKK